MRTPRVVQIDFHVVRRRSEGWRKKNKNEKKPFKIVLCTPKNRYVRNQCIEIGRLQLKLRKPERESDK